MEVLEVLIGLTLAGMAVIAISNTIWFTRLRADHQVQTAAHHQPSISILIPARNEATVISQTVQRLLDQSFTQFELLLLDDASTDATAAVAQEAGKGDSRLRIIRGAPLPTGWSGKNWACQQLSEQARGDILIFTDADVIWSPDALKSLVAEIERSQADLLTVWPTQHTQSWAERLVVPMMALAIVCYLPIGLVHHTPWSVFAAANGQCLAFRRRAYSKIGGHAAVRDQIVEDVSLARRIKKAGFRLRMVDGAGLIACRMYQDWPSVRRGFGKNILAGHGNAPLALVISTVFHWLIFIVPWFLLVMEMIAGREASIPLLLVSLGVLVRAISAAAMRQRIGDALLMPVSVMLMTVIAGQSLWWHWRYGGPQWKDRTIPSIGNAAHG
jgi:chlorobactene glucosyltransferase